MAYNNPSLQQRTISSSVFLDEDTMSSSEQKFDSLQDLLKHTRSNSQNHTHVLVGPPFGTFLIGGNRMKQFWNLYSKSVSRNETLYMAESPGKESPVLVDIDLKLKKSVMEEKKLVALYSLDDVKVIIKAYQNVLTKTLVGLQADSLTCVLLEKPKYEQNINGICYVKNGFHLHFPKLFLERTVLEIYIIPLVKVEVGKHFAKIGIDDCIDSNSVNVHWLMYGSKKPNNTPYLATKCFLHESTEVSFEKGLCDYKISNFKNENVIVTKENVKELLPRILSIFLFGRETLYYFKPKHSLNTPIMEVFADRKILRSQYEQMTISEALSEANRFLPMLSCKRADDRADWLAVGFCIWNISNGDDEGLSMWLEFSEMSDKYDEVECIHLWNRMRSNQYTIGTLRYFAKQDSPEEYEELLRERRHQLTSKIVKGSHNDIGQMLHTEYGNEFVCANVQSNTWYQFKNHMWHESDKGLDLRERISSNTGCILKSLFDKLAELKIAPSSESEKGKKNSDAEKLSKDVKAVIKQCKSAPFKNNVMTECIEIFRNGSFMTLLNKDPYLVAFTNGVYDFTSDSFRSGKPEDYLSVSLPMEYCDFGSVEHPRIMEIENFFQKIFPDPEVREYFLYLVSQVFIGGNSNKIMMFWTGTGDNGKTITQKLFERMLGPLAVKFSSSLITGKKAQLGAAAPEMSRAGNGVRWAVMDEPNQDELINGGTLKALTGNDSYWARDLFEKGKSAKEITPLFKLVMICNKLPGIRYADQAIWNRTKVIPFEAEFFDEDQCSDNLETQFATKRFPKDPKFEDNIPKMIQPLAWYLINKWRKSVNYRPVEPNKVKVATNVFRQENDVYRQFVTETISDKIDGKLMLSAVYTKFNEWFRIACPGQAMQSRMIIKEQFISVFGELVSGKYWEGLTLNEDFHGGNRNYVNPLL